MEVKNRKEIAEEYKWDLSHLYKNLDELNKDCQHIESNINELKNIEKNSSFSEKSNPINIKQCYDLVVDTSKTLSKLFVYVERYFDQEQNNEEADILVQKIMDINLKFSASISFINDDLIHFEDDVIDNLLSSEILIDYHFDIKHVLKSKKHILSKSEEELLSKISDVFSTSNDVYTIFKNTELKYSNVKLSDNSEVLIDNQNYRELRESSNRQDRKIAFDSFWKTFDDYKNTLSKLMFKFIKSVVTDVKIRKYDSALDSALSTENIPTSIYDNLIKNVSNNLNRFYDYLNLRKEILGYDELYYYDLYNPIVDNVDYKYTYDEAKELILKSTSILGEEYTKIITQALSESWIDVYPNKFKDTGAYMSGSAYDVHPYILLNYNDRYSDVSTLGHELGHAVHSVFSNKNQIYNKASYATFIAEIASTINEILLFDYMYKNTDDKQLKIFLLNNYIEHFRTTVFRQTMFAEFEKFMYETVENDNVLTASVLNNKYYELLKKYHNDMIIDELYSNEWASVPHFYYNFYVYQYSTSFISSIILSTKILNGDKEQLDKYLELLKSGGSDYPVELLKKAGVDLTDENCYNIAFEEFSKHLNELKTLFTYKIY
jgi:oligoendopeptidase F